MQYPEGIGGTDDAPYVSGACRYDLMLATPLSPQPTKFVCKHPILLHVRNSTKIREQQHDA